MSDQFLAEIRMFPGNFAPTGWALCNGQLMPISQNTALFSLLGTFYGGDGKSTFALPNLQGAVPIHQGQGQGLSIRSLGEQGGSPSVTLLPSEIPFHTHELRGTTEPATLASPEDAMFATPAAPRYRSSSTSFAWPAVAGGSLPHDNVQPSLGITFIIALVGIFPPRG